MGIGLGIELEMSLDFQKDVFYDLGIGLGIELQMSLDFQNVVFYELGIGLGIDWSTENVLSFFKLVLFDRL